MKIGYFTMPHHPLQRDWSVTLREDREAVILADRLGFHEAFIGEHATDAAETITSCLTFIASLAYETENIRLATGTLNLPNSHPVTIATHAAMVDHMLEGRFLLGIGPGALATDFEVFGTLQSDRRAMFLESIEQILGIWTGAPPYDLNGQFWNISTAKTMDLDVGSGVLPKPYQKPYPGVVCTALTPYSKGPTAVGERGWSLITSNFVQGVGAASHWQAFREGCENVGDRTAAKKWRVARLIFVAEDMETADRYAMSLDGPYGLCMRHIHYKLSANGNLGVFKNSPDQKDSAITPEYCMKNLVISGTPEIVADKILALRNVAGPFETLLYVGVDWQDRNLAQKSMELFAREVVPRINTQL